MNHPPRLTPRGLSVAGAIAALLLAEGVELAAAEGEGEPIRLEYRAGAGCPAEAAFVDRIRARTARARFVRAGGRVRTFTVELEGGARPSGSVTVVNGPRTEGTRRLEADTCSDVADALALMVALALDPHAHPAETPLSGPSSSVASGAGPVGAPDLAPDASEVEASVPEGSAPEPPAADAGAVDDAGPDSSSSSPASPSWIEPDVPATPPAPAPPRPPLHFFGGIDLALASDVTPTSPLFAGAPYVGWRSTREGLLGPSFRASFLRAGTGTLTEPGGAASFTWTVGRLDACAMLWPAGRLRLGGCARVEGGVLEGSGEQIANALTQRSAWVALGALARVEWSLLGPLFLDAEGGPTFRITADRFYFLPGTTVYDVPVVGFSSEAGLGVHFL